MAASPYRFDEALRRHIESGLEGQKRAALPSAGKKRAAVAITIIGDDTGEASLLLTRRTAKLSTNPGQWALPGGRMDPGENSIDAALRELHEEVGLALESRDVLGSLDDYATRSGYVITPLVLWGGPSPELRANPDEVASIHPIKLQAFERGDSPELISIPESEQPVLRLYFDDSRIHTPTAAFLYQFLELCLKHNPLRVSHFEQPVWTWK